MMIAREDGTGYDSASDYDEETLALIAHEDNAAADLIQRCNAWLRRTLKGMNL